MEDDALSALVRESTIWPASGPSASVAAIMQSLPLDQLRHLDNCLGKLAAGQLCVDGQLRGSTPHLQPELLPVTRDLPFTLACGLRLARVVKHAAGPASEGLQSGASAAGSDAMGYMPPRSVRLAGGNPSAADSLDAATEGEGACAASANVPPATSSALDACSGIGRTSAQSAWPSVAPVHEVGKGGRHADGIELPCQDAGSSMQAAESTYAPEDAAMAQSWCEPHEEGQRSAVLRSIADCSSELAAAWMWQFTQPTALTTALGLQGSPQHDRQPSSDNAAASQLPWHEKAVIALQMLEVLLDSCVLGDHMQTRDAAATASALAPPVLHFLQMHLHVRDLLSQHSGEATRRCQ